MITRLSPPLYVPGRWRPIPVSRSSFSCEIGRDVLFVSCGQSIHALTHDGLLANRTIHLDASCIRPSPWHGHGRRVCEALQWYHRGRIYISPLCCYRASYPRYYTVSPVTQCMNFSNTTVRGLDPSLYPLSKYRSHTFETSFLKFVETLRFAVAEILQLW